MININMGSSTLSNPINIISRLLVIKNNNIVVSSSVKRAMWLFFRCDSIFMHRIVIVIAVAAISILIESLATIWAIIVLLAGVHMASSVIKIKAKVVTILYKFKGRSYIAILY